MCDNDDRHARLTAGVLERRVDGGLAATAEAPCSLTAASCLGLSAVTASPLPWVTRSRLVSSMSTTCRSRSLLRPASFHDCAPARRDRAVLADLQTIAASNRDAATRAPTRGRTRRTGSIEQSDKDRRAQSLTDVRDATTMLESLLADKNRYGDLDDTVATVVAVAEKVREAPKDCFELPFLVDDVGFAVHDVGNTADDLTFLIDDITFERDNVQALADELDPLVTGDDTAFAVASANSAVDAAAFVIADIKQHNKEARAKAGEVYRSIALPHRTPTPNSE
jgi:hypothetical protein